MLKLNKVHGISYLIQSISETAFKLFLHGFPDTKEVWLPILTKLNGNLIAPDLPSFGESEIVPDSEMKVKVIAQKLLQLLDNLNINEIDIIAHDWGSIISWEIIAQAKERVKSLTIVNGTHPHLYGKLVANNSTQQTIGKYARSFCTLGVEKKLLESNLKNLKLLHPFPDQEGPWSEPYFTQKWSDSSRLAAALGIYRANLTDILIGQSAPIVADCPMRIFWGAKDHTLVSEHLKELPKYSTGHVEVEEVHAGHWAFIENSELFLKFICPQITT